MGTPEPQAVLGEVATYFSGVEDKGAIEKDGSTAFRNRYEAGNFTTGSASVWPSSSSFLGLNPDAYLRLPFHCAITRLMW